MCGGGGGAGEWAERMGYVRVLLESALENEALSRTGVGVLRPHDDRRLRINTCPAQLAHPRAHAKHCPV